MPVISVDEARALAERAHGSQRDRDGTLHIAHVERVAGRVEPSEACRRVAWLHDVVEDTDIGLEDLRERLPEAELEAVRLLTRGPESYEAYIDGLIRADGNAGTLARAVKEADMLDNLCRSVRDRDPAVGQYGRALARLWTRTPGSG